MKTVPVERERERERFSPWIRYVGDKKKHTHTKKN